MHGEASFRAVQYLACLSRIIHSDPKSSYIACTPALYAPLQVLQQDCVGNLTDKVEGDDSAYILDVFEDFMKRKVSTARCSRV
jgi:hypothetical protein